MNPSFPYPVKDDARQHLRGTVNHAVENFRAQCYRGDTDDQTDCSRDLCRQLLLRCQVHVELDAAGVDDDALDEEPA